MCNPLKRVNGAPYVPKLYATSGIDISKCIEGGNIKFTTLVDSIYICVCAAVQSRMHFSVMNVIFLMQDTRYKILYFRQIAHST